MATVLHAAGVGDLLRTWRTRRRLSQLDLALDAGVSQRHLSFVELGRSNPSRELILHLATELEVPLRERNALLLAAGYAPLYPETPLGSDQLLPVRHAMQKIVASHEPFPAVIVDRGWDLVWSNKPARTILTEGVAPELLLPRPNAVRVTLHPGGLAPRIRNLREYGEHMLDRLQRQAAIAHDPVLSELYEEVRHYPALATSEDNGGGPTSPVVPLRLDALGGELALFSTVATFGSASDVTVAELAIESFFPADRHTDAILRVAFPRI